MTTLPIESVLPEIQQAFRSGTAVVLQAPPGAGKTTRVPLALLDEPWLADRRIVMLEPRRLAARAAARRMAAMLDEKPGETVGYRVRLDTVVGPQTRVEVVTEGVLTRMLQEDPALEKYGLVIFDEFHERNLHADLGLALCLQVRNLLRHDLRLLVMSATLEGTAVARLLDNAPLITSKGRSHPVETHYLDYHSDEPVEQTTVHTVHEALHRHDGDILVFLPGSGEINRIERHLKVFVTDPRIRIFPLHGSLTQDDQQEAIEPAPPGIRKVVLSTPIAETSLTIEGTRVVIDSGLMRVPRFSPRSGMTRLHTVRVSKASADQRRGRAGRLGPGVCYRLWTRHTHLHLTPYNLPEITEADLAPLALELAAWGTPDPSELSWLDPPPDAAFSQAQDLLRYLGAVDPSGTITPHGREMARLSLHPRLAHMLLTAKTLGHGALACDIAAMLNERDLFRTHQDEVSPDLRLRLEALRRIENENRVRAIPHGNYAIDQGSAARIIRESRHLKHQLRIPSETPDIEACGLILAFAYPDRIARRRTGRPGRFILRNGQSAFLSERDPLADSDYLVAAELGGLRREHRIFRAAPVSIEDLEKHFREHIKRELQVSWDRESQSVRARNIDRLGALTIREKPVNEPDPDTMARAFLEGIREEGLSILPWTRSAIQLRERLAFMHHLDNAWPDVSDENLLVTLEEWLLPHLYEKRSRQDLLNLNVTSIFRGMLTWQQLQVLDEQAPTHVEVPSGSRIPIDYSNPDAPVLAVRLQEMFGATETPTIAGGRVPLTLHLLSPAHRPVQITRDLTSFWKSAYFDVRKDLRGRYPRHYWPENPLEATPTNRSRPRP